MIKRGTYPSLPGEKNRALKASIRRLKTQREALGNRAHDIAIQARQKISGIELRMHHLQNRIDFAEEKLAFKEGRIREEPYPKL